MDDAANETIDPQQEQEDEHLEQKIINEEYKIWKKNTPFLYDILYSRALEWPTLTVQWLPDKQAIPGKPFSTHRLILGTQTSGQADNYLEIATLDWPNPVTPDAADYDEERGEIGGHGKAKHPILFNVIQRINHPGDVNKARYQPQNPNIIATMCQDGNALIFDRSKLPSVPKEDGTVEAHMTLKGHTKEGYGLSWNPFEEGLLATGAEDSTVRLWDIKHSFAKGQKEIAPKRTWTNHTAVVNDVQFHPIHSFWVGAVSDDLTFSLLDLRHSTNEKALRQKEAHKDAVNCIAFHPAWDPIFVTGSADKTIGIWDFRRMDKKVHTLEAHRDAVVSLEWHPQEKAILASASYDRRVLFWDLSRIGEEQTAEEAEDGPPELLFMHGGHTSRVSDISWNKNDDWVMCSASEDNLIEVWRASRAIVNTLPKNSKVQNQELQD